MIPLSYNLRSMATRKMTTFATAGGIALVVFMFSSSLMLGDGIQKTVLSSGRSDNAIVVRMGSDAEMSSGVQIEQMNLVMGLPEVQKVGPSGTQGFGVGEILVVLTKDKKGTEGGVSNVTVRGVPANVWDFRKEAHIIEGVKPRPGTNEVAIGKAIRGRFEGIQLGQTFDLRKKRPVQVVGVFEAGGSSSESEVWADVQTVRDAFGRDGVVSSVRVRLTSPDAFDDFRRGVEENKQLGLLAKRETEWLADQSEGTAKFMTILGIVIAILSSLGAVIGAAITMYSAVANRQREIGILRALGFSRPSILGSFLLESLLLAALGGAIGAAASLLMGFVKFGMMNFNTWSEIVFRFDPSASTILWSVVFSCIVGVAGGFFPAWRASKVSPLEAMRA